MKYRNYGLRDLYRSIKKRFRCWLAEPNDDLQSTDTESAADTVVITKIKRITRKNYDLNSLVTNTRCWRRPPLGLPRL